MVPARRPPSIRLSEQARRAREKLAKKIQQKVIVPKVLAKKSSKGGGKKSSPKQPVPAMVTPAQPVSSPPPPPRQLPVQSDVNPPPGFPTMPVPDFSSFAGMKMPENPSVQPPPGFMYPMLNPYLMMGTMQAMSAASQGEASQTAQPGFPFMWPNFFPTPGRGVAPSATVSRPPAADADEPSTSTDGISTPDSVNDAKKQKISQPEPGTSQADDFVISPSEDDINGLDSDIQVVGAEQPEKSGSVLNATEMQARKKLPPPPPRKASPVEDNRKRDAHLPLHIQQAKQEAERLIDQAHESVKGKGKNIHINSSWSEI